MERVSIYPREELKKKLLMLSTKNNRSLNKEILFIITDYLLISEKAEKDF